MAFGPYQLDPRARLLLRDGNEVPLRPRHVDLVALLASRAGETVPRNDILDAVWPGQTIDDSSLTKAVSDLRTALDPANPDRYIVTAKGRGYRFVAPVVRVEHRPAIDLEALLAPYRALLEGRAALESLDRRRIAEARSAFESLAATHQDDARFHVGLANACVLQYEATRASAAPDTASLALAAEHAGRACELAPDYAEAWATLGFVLECTGKAPEAQAALMRATALEPGNGLHHLRLASASWGAARLRAAARAAELVAEPALARVLLATVHIARNALSEAEREIDAALASMRGEADDGSAGSAVAVYWLKGLLCLARGGTAGIDEAVAMCEREIARESQGHLYATECAASAWYAIGACALRRGDATAARTAFERAIARVPRHPMAHAGLMITGAAAPPIAMGDPEVEMRAVDAALARAALLAAAGRTPDAANLVAAALSAAPPGNSGWLLPIDPLLDVAQTRSAWAKAIEMLRGRAG